MSQIRQVLQFFRQEEATPAALRGTTVVVIDVLRASSVITTALAVGAREVRCFRTVRAAFQARRLTRGLLCGERKGLRISGFDLGNSPVEYTRERCVGRTLLMTTTNGTRALRRTRKARDVVIGCFLNAKALVKYLLKQRGDTSLLCAGTEGDVSEEDVSCAGAICCELAANGLELTAPAQEAARLWSRAARRGLGTFLAQSRGGVPLVKLGLERDIRFCAQRDVFSLVPRLANRGTGLSKPRSAEDNVSSRRAGSDLRNAVLRREGFRIVPAQPRAIRRPKE